MNERQTNYTIMEGYELPSKGKIYDKDVNSHVELRSMTARDEMKRLSPSTTPLKTLSDIIEGCMLEKPAIHVYDMCSGDYEYLLHKLRIVTYGPKYNLTCKCPECLSIVDGEANLETLDIQEFDIEKFNENRTFVLPVSKKTVTLKIQSPRLLEETEAKVKDMQRKFKSATLDFQLLCKLICNIESIDGIKYNQYDLEGIVSDLAAMDMQKILLQIDNLTATIGLDSSLYITCPNCGNEIATFIRYGPEFFRPTNI